MAYYLRNVRTVILAAMLWPLTIASITANYLFLTIPFFSKLDLTNKRKFAEIGLFLIFLILSWLIGIVWFAEPQNYLRGTASSFSIILPFLLLFFKAPFGLSTIKKSVILVCCIYSLLVVYHMIFSLDIPFFYADGAKSRLQPFVPDWPQRFLIVLGLALIFLLHQLKSKISIVQLGCFVLILYAFFMSFTRTAYLALLLSLVYYLAPSSIRINKKALKYFLLSTIGIISLIIYDYYNQQLSFELFEKISAKFVEAFGALNEGSNERSVSERFETWKEILKFTLTHNPISGSGGIGAGLLKTQGMIDIPNNSAHSQYFDIFLRYGFIGLVFFYYFFVKLFVSFGKEIKTCIIFILLYGVTHETLKMTYILLFFIMLINLSYERKVVATKA